MKNKKKVQILKCIPILAPLMYEKGNFRSLTQ